MTGGALSEERPQQNQHSEESRGRGMAAGLTGVSCSTCRRCPGTPTRRCHVGVQVELPADTPGSTNGGPGPGSVTHTMTCTESLLQAPPCRRTGSMEWENCAFPLLSKLNALY